MKTSSLFLWQLIQSLSPGEKLFFKRNFTSNGPKGQRLYLKIFDALALQKEYDEAAIIKKFSPGLTKKNIASQKHYLQKQICEAIVQYDGKNKTGQDLYKQILLIRVYRKKGMTDEAHAIWKKAVIKARKTESFALLNLLKTEFEKMVLFSSFHTSYDDLHSIFQNNIITYNEYAELITLRDIYAEALLLKRKSHFDLDDNLKKKVDLLLQRVNNSPTGFSTQSFWFRHYFRMSKATLLYLKNEIPESFQLIKQVHDDWKKNLNFIKTDGEYYIELMYMINYAGILVGSYNYVTNCFNDEINDLIEDTSQRANFEAIKFLALNKILNKTAQYDEVEKLFQFMKEKYKIWEPVLNADLNRTINLSIGLASFILEHYNDALYYSKRAFTYFKAGVREEHTAVAQILLLLITYNLNNARLFDAQYRNTYTFFYKRKKNHPFETALVQCLRHTFYMKDNKSKITEYKKALDIFEVNKEDVVQQMNFSIFNYPGWLISKVQRIPYRVYVERKVRGEKADV